MVLCPKTLETCALDCAVGDTCSLAATDSMPQPTVTVHAPGLPLTRSPLCPTQGEVCAYGCSLHDPCILALCKTTGEEGKGLFPMYRTNCQSEHKACFHSCVQEGPCALRLSEMLGAGVYVGEGVPADSAFVRAGEDYYRITGLDPYAPAEEPTVQNQEGYRVREQARVQEQADEYLSKAADALDQLGREDLATTLRMMQVTIK